MANLLIGLHVILGSIALIGMITAWTTKKGSLWHRRGGKAYILGMTGALLAAFAISIMKHNAFLFLVGLFTTYLIYTGYRAALARDGVRNTIDVLFTKTALLISFCMILYGLFNLTGDMTVAIVSIVFGAILGTLAFGDYRLANKWPAGKERIILHLVRMGGASIATVTAVLVANVQTEPAFIGWLLPTVVGLVAISYFVKKTRAVKAPLNA